MSPAAHMCSSDVRMRSSTLMCPEGVRSSPASLANAVLGRTPIAKITMSARKVLPEVRTTSDAMEAGPSPASPSLKAETPSDKCNETPLLRNSMCKYCAISASNGAITCGAISTMCTSGKPFIFICSANSRPMKPPPQTTTRSGCFVAMYSSIAAVSSMLRSTKCPGRSMPSMDRGTMDSQPIASTNSSYSCFVSKVVPFCLTVIVLAAASTLTTS
mmetsp:Transcript_93012/g.268669  ORF Transcript_93012/g.268669 Transcript_93012/m.268669 type:complete len:216 (+) Transcript_93012:927-1574(+)